MSATNDTPLKRFTAFWVVLGAFLLFGLLALILAPLANTSEVTAADEAGAIRRLAIREQVDAEQAKLLARAEKGDKMQVPPSEIFALVGAKLAASKPKPFENDQFRDPNLPQPEAETPAEDPASTEAEAPASAEAPATPPVAPEASPETADPLAN